MPYIISLSLMFAHHPTLRHLNIPKNNYLSYLLCICGPGITNKAFLIILSSEKGWIACQAAIKNT